MINKSKLMKKARLHIFCFTDIIKILNYIFILLSLFLLQKNYQEQIVCNLAKGNKYPAFSLNTVPFNKDKSKIIEAVIIHGINNITIKNKVLSYLRIKTAILKNKKIAQVHVLNILNCLKDSGFFTSIKSSTNLNNNKIQIHIHLCLNPIVQRIRIIKLSTLQIPETYTLSLLSLQLGLPKNFRLISNSLGKMRYWYSARGFRWAKVELSDQSDIPSEISININEGIIGRSKLTCIDCYNEKKISFLNQLIRKELNINVGNVLNSYRLESGIIRLREQKIISNCSYKVNNNANQLVISLQYSQVKGTTTCFFNRVYIISETLQNLLNCKIRNSLHYILDKQITYGSTNRLSPILTEIIYPNDSRINYTITRLIFFNIQKLALLFYGWSFENISFFSSNYLGFRHYLYNSIIKNNTLLIDVRLHYPFLLFNFNYRHPLLKPNNKNYGHINVSIFKKISELYNNKLLILLQKSNDKNIHEPHSIIQLRGVEIDCGHQLFTKISILENILIQNLLYQYKYLYKNVSLWNLRNFTSNYNYDALHKLHRIIKQNLICIKTKLKYDTIDLTCRLKPGKLFVIQSKHFIPTRLNYFKQKKRQHENYCNELNIKYKQISSIPQILNLRHENALVLCSQLNVLIGNKNYLPFYKDFMLVKPNITDKYSNNLVKPILGFYLLSMEYHILTPYHSSLFIFTEYTKNLKLMMHNPIQNYIQRDISDNSFNNFIDGIHIGLGVQLNIPIQKIPSLKLEYSINIKGKQSLHTRLTPI
nr:hypothetical protein Ahn.fas.Kor.pt_232 [Ahnfeltia fastigiata]